MAHTNLSKASFSVRSAFRTCGSRGVASLAAAFHIHVRGSMGESPASNSPLASSSASASVTLPTPSSNKAMIAHSMAPGGCAASWAGASLRIARSMSLMLVALPDSAVYPSVDAPENAPPAPAALSAGCGVGENSACVLSMWPASICVSYCRLARRDEWMTVNFRPASRTVSVYSFQADFKDTVATRRERSKSSMRASYLAHAVWHSSMAAYVAAMASLAMRRSAVSLSLALPNMEVKFVRSRDTTLPLPPELVAVPSAAVLRAECRPAPAEPCKPELVTSRVSGALAVRFLNASMLSQLCVWGGGFHVMSAGVEMAAATQASTARRLRAMYSVKLARHCSDAETSALCWLWAPRTAWCMGVRVSFHCSRGSTMSTRMLSAM